MPERCCDVLFCCHETNLVKLLHHTHLMNTMNTLKWILTSHLSSTAGGEKNPAKVSISRPAWQSQFCPLKDSAVYFPLFVFVLFIQSSSARKMITVFSFIVFLIWLNTVESLQPSCRTRAPHVLSSRQPICVEEVQEEERPTRPPAGRHRETKSKTGGAAASSTSNTASTGGKSSTLTSSKTHKGVKVKVGAKVRELLRLLLWFIMEGKTDHLCLCWRRNPTDTNTTLLSPPHEPMGKQDTLRRVGHEPVEK